jgi:hypothetical protein
MSRGVPMLSSMSTSLISGLPQNQSKLLEARTLLADLGFDQAQQNDRSVLVLLALANLAPDLPWAKASAPLLRTTEIMAWIRDRYGVAYAPNTRETIRSFTLLQFLEAGLIAYNPDDPSRSVNSARSCYQLRDEALEVLRRYGSPGFTDTVGRFRAVVASSQSSGRELADQPRLDILLSGLVSKPAGLRAVEVAVIQGRRQILANLQALVTAPDTSEADMQKILQDNHWIFGGQYVGVSPRRDLVPMQQHDILLVAADKSVTIVELKGPNDPLLGQPREQHLTVSSAVNNAVGQCMNYLRSMDEFALSLGTKNADDLGLDYDFRRANAIVVIGHPSRPGKIAADRARIDQALRMYNSHLTRIRVLTYADLLEASERALQFEA